jgi:hypothetical protein
MTMTTTLLLTFGTYFVVLFAACFAVIEFGQTYLYDEKLARSGLRCLVGALILAAVHTYMRPSFDTMFTSRLPWTLLLGVIWFVVFLFVFQFHPPHALLIGVVTMIIAGGMAQMAADSLTSTRPPPPPAGSNARKPFRQSAPANPGAAAVKAEDGKTSPDSAPSIP